MRVCVSLPAGGRRRVVALAAGAALVAGSAAACSGDSIGGAAASKKPPAKLSVTPASDAKLVRPDSSIVVKATDGTIQNVTVTLKGQPVEGTLSADKTEWKSRWALSPASKYQVAATALGQDGKTQSLASGFSTAKVKESVAASVTAPNPGEKVGVGMPIMLHFDREVFNRAEVEKALEVRSSKPVQGAWHWTGSQDVIFRTKTYWPAQSKVRVIAHMSGVRAAKGVYGTKNLDLKFSIGDQHISTAGEDNHHMIVKKNGKKVRSIPISMGKGGLRKYTTTNGIHLTMDKEYLTIMDSTTTGCPKGCPDYYREEVYWTVRISDSGEYVHAAPWSVGSQGNSNVSHGCLNASTSNAIWFYKFSNRGDVVKVTGTSRELEPENGWGYWQLSWKDWLKASALKQGFNVGPEGSTLIDPAAAPAPTTAATPSATPTTPAPSATTPSAATTP